MKPDFEFLNYDPKAPFDQPKESLLQPILIIISIIFLFALILVLGGCAKQIEETGIVEEPLRVDITEYTDREIKQNVSECNSEDILCYNCNIIFRKSCPDQYRVVFSTGDASDAISKAEIKRFNGYDVIINEYNGGLLRYAVCVKDVKSWEKCTNCLK